MRFISHGPQPDFRKVSAGVFPVRVRKSVTLPSNAVKRRNGKQTGGRRLALRASLRPPVSTLAGWLIGMDVNGDKTKYIDVYRDQNVGRSHSIKTDNSLFGRVDEFKFL